MNLLREEPSEYAVSFLLEAEELYEESYGTPPPESVRLPLDEELRLLHDKLTGALASVAIWSFDHNIVIPYFLRRAEVNLHDPEPFLQLARASAVARRHGEARRYYRAYLARKEKLAEPAAPFPGPGRA